MGKVITFFSLLFLSGSCLAQGLVKEEVPREFIAPKKVTLKVKSLDPFTISTDSLAVRKWNQIAQSYEKLQYLRTNGLISRKEFIEFKARLLLRIQEYQGLLGSEEYTVIDN
jgi:hypothetical protein